MGNRAIRVITEDKLDGIKEEDIIITYSDYESEYISEREYKTVKESRHFIFYYN